MPTPVTIPAHQMGALRDLFNTVGSGVGNRGYQPAIDSSGGNVNLSSKELRKLRKSVGGEYYNEAGAYVGSSTNTSSYSSGSFSRQTGILWSKLPEDAFEELALAYEQTIKSELRAKMKAYAGEARRWMVQNAPWGDRSGAARSGLGSNVGGNQYGTWMVLFHTVPYGTYLEGINPATNQPMLNAGEFSIIEPAIDYFSKRIWSDVAQMFRS